MANISSIKLPNGTTYTIVDKTSGYTKNTGTVTSVAASGSGGISISGSPITTSGTIAIGLNLTSDTALTNAALSVTEDANRIYPVRIDKNSKLVVVVPWTNVNSSYLTSSSTLNAAKLSGAIPSAVTATTQASTDNSTKIATTAYVTTAIANLPEPMIFKGSVGTGGTITSLPTAAASNEGWTYKVITALSSPAAKVGDTVISNGSSWVVIPSGDEPSGTVTSIAAGTGLNTTSNDTTTDGGTITSSGTIYLTKSGVTAGSYGDSAAQTPGYGSTFKVPYITVDKYGRVTGISEHTVKIPASDNTNTTYTLTNALASHKFTWTLTPSSGSATTTIAELVQGTGIALTDDTSNKKITIANAGVTSITTAAGAHTTKSSATGAVSFNVPTKTSHLTNDSGFLTSHQTLYEENIQWGPTSVSKSGSVSPIGMSLSAEHSANRLAYINGAALDFEYSSDGGSTWTNYNYTALDKTAFCTTSYGVPIGRISGNYTTSSRTRLTITAQNGTTGYVYTNPKKLLVNISSSGGMNVLIEYRSGTNYQNNGSWTTFGTYALSGWSGWNDIPLILGTLGGGTNQTSNNWQLRLTFIMTSVNSSYPTTAHVNSIRLFGENGWTVTSNMGSTGHLYSYDASQNATFPAKVTASGGFSGNLTGNVTGNVSGSAGSVAWSGVSGKPTATGSATTGITIAAHGTGTVIGVQSTTTTASKVTLGTAISVPNVTGNTDVTVPIRADSDTTVPKAAGSATTVPIKNASATTVPTAASSATTVPIKDASATSCDDITAWSAGSGSASLTFTMDTTDTKKLKIAFSHSHSVPSLSYTARSIIGVQSSTTSVTGVSGSTSIYGVQSSTTSVTGVSGSTTVRGVKTGDNSTTTASKVTLGTAKSIPNVTAATDVTVPIKNSSASTFVTGTTHTITDNGHTHSI